MTTKLVLTTIIMSNKMSSIRDTVITLEGYYYQFDFFILQLLEAAADDIVVTLDGMEDVDIKTATDTTAVQCKYYAGTDYTHSKIATTAYAWTERLKGIGLIQKL